MGVEKKKKKSIYVEVVVSYRRVAFIFSSFRPVLLEAKRKTPFFHTRTNVLDMKNTSAHVLTIGQHFFCFSPFNPSMGGESQLTTRRPAVPSLRSTPSANLGEKLIRCGFTTEFKLKPGHREQFIIPGAESAAMVDG